MKKDDFMLNIIDSRKSSSRSAPNRIVIFQRFAPPPAVAASIMEKGAYLFRGGRTSVSQNRGAQTLQLYTNVRYDFSNRQ